MRYLTPVLCLFPAIAAVMPAATPGPSGPASEAAKARSYLASGDYPQAEASLHRALAAAVDTDYARTLRNALADLLREEGRVAESRRYYGEVLNSGHISPRQKYDAFSGMADLDGLTGNPDKAEAEWNEAIAAARELSDASLEADSTRGLGMTWLDAGNPSRAEPLLRRALKMMEDTPGAKPWQTAAVLTCLGRCYRMENKLALAEDHLSRALAIERTAFGETHPQYAYVMERLAEVYSLRNQNALARDYSTRALAVMRVSCGENSGAMVAALVNRAGIEQRAGALDAAAEYYASALKIVRAHPEAAAQNDRLEAQILERYAAVLRASHHDREAKELSTLAKSLRPQAN